MRVSLIAAVADNGVIGREGGLPWHLPADLGRFKRLTTGHHLIVGRATWESVGRPLPGRTFVVVTSRPDYAAPGATVVRSLAEAIRLARAAGDDEPFVAGGAGIYREALERGLVDRLYLTRIHRAYAGDTRFPAWDESAWRVVEEERHVAEAQGDRPAFDFVVLERRRPPRRVPAR
ncbi:MAG: dihydrofolate reductase [Thermoanaerobaculia bacterium]|nr:MAG: dihydrofolate reductase [Thermoanaerobaculia bacterium]